MRQSVFLSHSKHDKAFVRRLAHDLECQGVRCWMDEAELDVGDSLIEKIRPAIRSSDFLIVVLSLNSVKSSWVQDEVRIARDEGVDGRRIPVLPVLYRRCELPNFLQEMLFANFTQEHDYDKSLRLLTESIGSVFNPKALDQSRPTNHLGVAVDKSACHATPILAAPFHRPFQYVKLPVAEVAKMVDAVPNRVGNIVIHAQECDLLLEAEGAFVSFAEATLKNTAPHSWKQEFDPEIVLGAFSINPAELDYVRQQTHFHTYYDHGRKLKVCVHCVHEGGPLAVSFSAKYYGA